MADICAARYEAFGAAGMASKMGRIFNLDEMHQRYAKGELDAKIK